MYLLATFFDEILKWVHQRVDSLRKRKRKKNMFFLIHLDIFLKTSFALRTNSDIKKIMVTLKLIENIGKTAFFLQYRL